MDAGEARALFVSARVARLATVDAERRPHLVPVTFAFDGDEIVTAVDHKPKRTTRLRRLENIEANPRVSVLADNYEDDWSKLWWARADGMARIGVPVPPSTSAPSALAARYPQYVEEPPERQRDRDQRFALERLEVRSVVGEAVMNDDVDPAFLRGITEVALLAQKAPPRRRSGGCRGGPDGVPGRVRDRRHPGHRGARTSTGPCSGRSSTRPGSSIGPTGRSTSTPRTARPPVDRPVHEADGDQVNYRAVIQDNPSFFAQISPVLAAGQSIGYDLIVISDGWELTQLIQNRWLIPLDQSRMPNFHRYAGSIARDPPFDPGNRYSASWQSGLTGIAYDPA